MKKQAPSEAGSQPLRRCSRVRGQRLLGMSDLVTFRFFYPAAPEADRHEGGRWEMAGFNILHLFI